MGSRSVCISLTGCGLRLVVAVEVVVVLIAARLPFVNIHFPRVPCCLRSGSGCQIALSALIREVRMRSLLNLRMTTRSILCSLG